MIRRYNGIIRAMMKYLLTAAILWPLTAPAAAATEDTQMFAKKAEAYLNSNPQIKAEFEQFVPGEAISSGTFYLKRPGHFMWAYNKPREEKVVANAHGLFYVEEEGGEVTQIPAPPALTQLFTAKTIDFSNLHITSLQNNTETFSLQFDVKDEEEVLGAASISFSKEPFTLRSLTTADPAGQQVFVRFYNVEKQENISNSLFNVETPFGF